MSDRIIKTAIKVMWAMLCTGISARVTLVLLMDGKQKTFLWFLIMTGLFLLTLLIGHGLSGRGNCKH